MKSETSLHKTQVVILNTLRHATRARYSELLKPTGLEGDVFKYHLNRLLRLGYVIKSDDGLYEMTAEGKEFTNRLDMKTGKEIAQPKASMLLVLRCQVDDETYYLAHRRTREPFREFWGIASAPVLRGLPIAQAAAHECKKQTGIDADFRVVALQRVIDTQPNGTVLEDKMFSVMCADVSERITPHYWYGGESIWLTRDELMSKARLFPTTARTLDMVEHEIFFTEYVCIYQPDEY